jgi:hypothetical protein
MEKIVLCLRAHDAGEMELIPLVFQQGAEAHT